MMSSALTREYAERTAVNKTSLDISREKDSEDYQSFVGDGFYFGFRFWTEFRTVFRFLIGP